MKTVRTGQSCIQAEFTQAGGRTVRSQIHILCKFWDFTSLQFVSTVLGYMILDINFFTLLCTLDIENETFTVFQNRGYHLPIDAVLLNCIWNREGLPQKRKESINVTIYMNGNKTHGCYGRMSLLSTTYETDSVSYLKEPYLLTTVFI